MLKPFIGRFQKRMRIRIADNFVSFYISAICLFFQEEEEEQSSEHDAVKEETTEHEIPN